MTAYPWITKEFLTSILNQIEKNPNISIDSFEIKNALGKGENFASNIMRIIVNYRTDSSAISEKQISFVQKSMPIEENVDYVNDFIVKVFVKEIDVYTKILPCIEMLLETAHIDDPIAPKYFAADLQLKYILFEDLCSAGFKTVDKEAGLDFNHLKIALSKLALWHATTAVLNIQDPNLFRRHKDCVLEDDGTGLIQAYTQNLLKSIAKTAKQWPGYYEISERLENLVETGHTRSYDEMVANDLDFNVFTHSDFWSNNVLFKYDESGNVCDAKLIDFTMGFVGSPMSDLRHILYTSSHLSVREFEWDQLIEHYHTKLNETLVKLNYPKKIPSLRDIQAQAYKGLYNALIGILLNSIRCATNVDGNDIMIFFTNNENDAIKRVEILSNPKSIENIKYLLDFYARKNII